jgi:hypothetical protein
MKYIYITFSFAIILFFLLANSGISQTSYIWIGTNGSSWATSTNWSPTRTTPASNDVLMFNDGTTKTIIAVPGQTIGQLFITNNTTISLQSSSAVTLTISGGTGTDFLVGSGSTLNLINPSSSPDFSITIYLIAGVTSSISGNITLSASSKATNHKLTATDVTAYTFNEGSVLTAGTNFSGSVFGSTGTANIAIFNSGSTYVCIAGSNPFALTQPKSKVIFQPGSNYIHQSSQSPSFSGRTYSNFELNSNGSTISATGNVAVSIDNLTITSGTLKFSMDGDPTNHHSIRGNISVANGAALNFYSTYPGAMVWLNGTNIQSINVSGSLTSNSNYTIVCSNTNGISLGGDMIVSGVFNLERGTFNIGAHTLALNGGISQTGGTLTGGASSNIIFGGSDSLTTLPAITLNNLTINRPNGIKLGGNVTINGTLTLTSGLLKTETNTIYFEPSASNFIESSGSRIEGTVVMNARNVGTGELNFLSINMQPGSDDLGTVRIIRTTGTAGIVSGGGNTSIACIWNIIPINQPVLGRIVTYNWLSDLDNGKTFSSFSKAQVWVSDDGVIWNPSGSTIDVSGSNPRTISASATHFSYWTTSSEGSPLPVLLTAFCIKLDGRNVNVSWTTSKEINNKGFEIQRKEIKINSDWMVAGFVNGKSFSNSATQYSFEDSKLNSGKYQYRLKQIDLNGNNYFFDLSNIIEVAIPVKFKLSQNYPNPFNPSTKVDYELPIPSKVTLLIYDVSGRLVRTVIKDVVCESGYHTIEMYTDGISSGIYFYKFTAKSLYENYMIIKKMCVIK